MCKFLLRSADPLRVMDVYGMGWDGIGFAILLDLTPCFGPRALCVL